MWCVVGPSDLRQGFATGRSCSVQGNSSVNCATVACNESVISLFAMASIYFRVLLLVCQFLSLSFYTAVRAASEDKSEAKASYAYGDAIPVSCLNRTT